MPSDAAERESRQREILAYLERGDVARQNDLVEYLRKRGIAATQSSVSRDLRDLGVARIGGRYVASVVAGFTADEGTAAAPAFTHALDFLQGARPAGPHLTVVHTSPGAAQTVALAFDTAQWPEVVGTVAGDDTVFVATADPRDQKRFLTRVSSLAAQRRGGGTLP
jgi:transcriptional regulator of arginine metabolism